IPTVTFQDLDGSAQPVPAGPTGRCRLAPDGAAYATVRTVADPADA
ncbi:MAG: Tat pathway signal sequence domain protein, partial [Streptomyces sp.]|nr:Tat pathway signal sequence domain protein [Streptomyces sp.]